MDRLARAALATSSPWRVHSVFAHAINLQAADGRLLAIVDGERANGPATLVLRRPREQQPEPLFELAAVGAPAARIGDRLYLGARLVLVLAGAAIWSPEPVLATLPPDEIARRLGLAAEAAVGGGASGGLAELLESSVWSWSNPLNDAEAAPSPLGPVATAGPSAEVGGTGRETRASRTNGLLIQRAGGMLRELLAAARRGDWDACAEPARALSGLGPGLTPSGDDLLAGFALGLRARRGSLPATLAASLKDAVSGRTTDVAMARVRHAVDGHADERTHRVLSALLTDPAADLLPTAIDDLLGYGHSSGIDTLVGLLAGAGLGP
ncbi:MAG: DUF2877 domain-containing protein [Chloroflexi bacterium]|nr:DUF2877 domain-containing protein [Chloroflexota bacterium]